MSGFSGFDTGSSVGDIMGCVPYFPYSEYWVYLRSRIERMEKLWIESHTETAEECPSRSATAPSNVATKAGRR